MPGIPSQFIPPSDSPHVRTTYRPGPDGSVSEHVAARDGDFQGAAETRGDLGSGAFARHASCRCGHLNVDGQCVSGAAYSQPFAPGSQAQKGFFDDLWRPTGRGQPLSLAERRSMLRSGPPW